MKKEYKILCVITALSLIILKHLKILNISYEILSILLILFLLNIFKNDLIGKDENEYFTPSVIDAGACSTIGSIYNSNTVIVTNLNVTGTANVGNITLSNGSVIYNDLVINGSPSFKNITVANNHLANGDVNYGLNTVISNSHVIFTDSIFNMRIGYGGGANDPYYTNDKNHNLHQSNQSNAAGLYYEWIANNF